MPVAAPKPAPEPPKAAPRQEAKSGAGNRSNLFLNFVSLGMNTV